MNICRSGISPRDAATVVFGAIFAVILLLGVAACTVTTIAPTWVTLKLIENETVTPEEVVDHVAHFRTLLDTGVTLAAIGTEVREKLGYQHMLPSDRLLVDALLSDIADRIDLKVTLPLGEEHIAAIHRVLDQINLYASMH